MCRPFLTVDSLRIVLGIISPFPRPLARPGGLVDSRTSAKQAVDDDRQHAKRMAEGEPQGYAPGLGVFTLALQVPQWLRAVCVIKDVPAGILVKDTVHGVPPS